MITNPCCQLGARKSAMFLNIVLLKWYYILNLNHSSESIEESCKLKIHIQKKYEEKRNNFRRGAALDKNWIEFKTEGTRTCSSFLSVSRSTPLSLSLSFSLFISSTSPNQLKTLLINFRQRLRQKSQLCYQQIGTPIKTPSQKCQFLLSTL